MNNGHLVNYDVDESSAQFLDEVYQRGLIPAEKSPFLIDLERCGGPFMATSDGRYFLDVASQIATKGLGFNAGAMFGASQFLETWTGDVSSDRIEQIRFAFQQLLEKLLGWTNGHMHLSNSGAEANEIALGICFAHRTNPAARKILAFQGAFHGRMMVALSCTWNQAKREPFAWDNCDTTFVPYPAMMDHDDVTAPAIPAGWNLFWSQAAANDGPGSDDLKQLATQRFGPGDETLQLEIETLATVCQQLRSGQHYAVIIEPMQCEGGDRYSSARFHNGLINVTRACKIPLVYDEIQTGCGLGGDFFWHRKFNLLDPNDRPLQPDHVVLAKKAQLGVTLSSDHSRKPCDFDEQYSAASLIRGFIQASMIDQFRHEIDAIETRSRQELGRLAQSYPDQIERTRCCGLSFVIDFHSHETRDRFVTSRFRFGLIFYPAGNRGARFRLNLAFRGDLLDLAWQRIETALQTAITSNKGSVSDLTDTDKKSLVSETDSVAIAVPQVGSYLDFHKRFLSAKLLSLQGLAPVGQGADAFLKQAIDRFQIQAWSVFVTRSNWHEYRQQVWDLQSEIYEPLRQTSIKKFDTLIHADGSLAIVVVKEKKIIAMAFGAPPVNFPEESGLPEDPWFDDPHSIYMLDLTVIPEYRGKLGRTLKQAFCLAAQSAGMKAVMGRNRDRLARGMWAINLSLGSYCTRVLENDYQDEHDHRDCLMYRCELDWQDSPVRLSGGVTQPVDAADLNDEFCHSNLPLVANRLNLFSFATRDYVQQLDRVFGLLPGRLRHGYAANGMSECTDKLVKALWLSRKPRRKLIVIGSAFFGHGSFLSRALSKVPDPFFEVVHLGDDSGLGDALRAELESDDTLAVFVEPLGSKTGQRLQPESLVGISEICQRFDTPLVTHDSAGMFHRYSTQAFLPSALPGFRPDAGMLFLGGQMAVCFLDAKYFVDTPMTFVSTWEGDCLSLAQFDLALDCAEKQPAGDLMNRFHDAMLSRLSEMNVTEHNLEGGVGWFRGAVDSSFAQHFDRTSDGRFLSCPNQSSILKFLAMEKKRAKPK